MQGRAAGSTRTAPSPVSASVLRSTLSVTLGWGSQVNCTQRCTKIQGQGRLLGARHHGIACWRAPQHRDRRRCRRSRGGGQQVCRQRAPPALTACSPCHGCGGISNVHHLSEAVPLQRAAASSSLASVEGTAGLLALPHCRAPPASARSLGSEGEAKPAHLRWAGQSELFQRVAPDSPASLQPWRALRLSPGSCTTPWPGN